MNKGKQYRVLIIDDHTMVREGLKWILESSDLFVKIDQATNGLEGLDCLEKEGYDIILLDMRMPLMDGIGFLDEKDRRKLTGKVIIITSYHDPAVLGQLRHHQIHGYLLKEASREEILNMIDDVINGTLAYPIDYSEETEKFNRLTLREWEILKEMLKGITSKEIATDLKVSERTIKAHLTNIYRKLEVNSRTEATALVLKNSNGIV